MNPHTRLAAVLLVLGVATASVHARALDGSLTFTGAGTELLTDTIFVPAVYAGAPGSWSFFDAADEIAVVLVESEEDPTRTSLVSVSENAEDGDTWIALGLFAPVPGVTIDGNTATFVDVVLSISGTSPPRDLIVNGSLTRSDEVHGGSSSFGALKVDVIDRR